MTAEKGPYHCIECGFPAVELYRDFNAGIIKIAHCDKCGKEVDKYIEFDSMIIFVDALLHKPQAYRHILFNVDFQAPWRLLLIFLLCDTYIKWEALHDNNNNSQQHDEHLFNAALEADFYHMFALALAEWCIFCVITMGGLRLLHARCMLGKTVCTPLLLRGLVISSFGKLFAIPVILWVEANRSIYVLLANIFIFTSNTSAVQVLFKTSRFTTSILLAIAHLLAICAGQQLFKCSLYFSTAIYSVSSTRTLVG